MFEIVQAAGWPIWFLIIASVLALALVIERFMVLRQSVILPEGLLAWTIEQYQENADREALIQKLESESLLGGIFAAGLKKEEQNRDRIKESMEDAGRLVANYLEKHLTALGTIAAISPLLGLFGTVVGMIEIFSAPSASGTDPEALAHGISVALYNTALGLLVAVPSMIFYRHFKALVNQLLLLMEKQSVKLLDVISNGEKDEV